MAQDNYARLEGQRVRLDGGEGPFRRCPVCASVYGIIGKGSGPHVASLQCAQCDRRIAWLSRLHIDALKARKGAA